MSAYATLQPDDWSTTLEWLRERVGQTASLEEAAALVAQTLRERFTSGTVLARVYAVVPYRELEPSVTAFVDDLATRTGQTERVTPETPVLTLLGTHGAEGAWCDRRASVGHRAIPLVSAAFVQDIPMVARLLKELGVDLAWLDASPEVNARRLLGGFNGVFYVADAESVRDAQGRLVIPAQDFVAEHGVKTVFGMGGFYPDGTLLAIIVFANEYLKRSQVESLTGLISMVKGETFGVVRGRRIFRQP